MKLAVPVRPCPIDIMDCTPSTVAYKIDNWHVVTSYTYHSSAFAHIAYGIPLIPFLDTQILIKLFRLFARTVTIHTLDQICIWSERFKDRCAKIVHPNPKLTEERRTREAVADPALVLVLPDDLKRRQGRSPWLWARRREPSS